MNFNRTSTAFGTHHATQRTRTAFTMIEILEVIGIIAILLGILLPTLSAVRGNALRAGSMANMKQVFLLMQSYAQANRDTIVPSAFDHSAAVVKGKPRSEPTPPSGQQYKGTWADILWSDAGFGPIAILANDSDGSPVVNEYQYRFDSPDDLFYEQMNNFERSPFRSKAAVMSPYTTYDESTKSPERPMSLDSDIANNKLGGNVVASGLAGTFAANNFFDSRIASRANTNHRYDAPKGPYFTFGEMVRPEISAYLIDSSAGETIDTVDSSDSGALAIRPFNCEFNDGPSGDDGSPTQVSLGQVDFRYPGETCLLLLLDGHVQSEARWESIFELEGGSNTRKDNGTFKDSGTTGDQGRGLRFRHLDMR